MRVLAVVPGPPTHGVVLHALTVAHAVGADVQHDLRKPDASYDIVHVPFTDSLFGADIGSAAKAFQAWAAGVGVPLVVTLHDVPGGDADPARDARRRAGYARVTAAADAVIVSSAHEADRLDPRPVVGPLLLAPLAAPGPPPVWAGGSTLGVLGFLYPGKGHDRVLDAAVGTGAAVVALGAPSPGHGDLVVRLHAQAERLGVELRVTGALSEPDLHAAARSITVPVAAYTTAGASASLATWTAAGRRPVTTPGPYAVELAARVPDALLLSQDLHSGVADALADPSSTWTDAAAAGPDVTEAHLAVYRSVLR
ncbi:hypothetical protein BH24ACT10_BH24ACT10_19010 [soil metagenome]